MRVRKEISRRAKAHKAKGAEIGSDEITSMKQEHVRG